MVKTLRKRHLQVWVTLAVLLPAGIVAAVITRPAQISEKLLPANTAIALPVKLKTVDRESFTVNLRCNADTSAMQLEWINKHATAYPSTLVYQLGLPGNDSLLIGRIEGGGTYHFALRKLPVMSIELYDIIHHQKITSFKF